MSKIGAEHLSRRAYVYVRQSTLDQVHHNRESQLRQYGLADRARGLGWPDATVIDDDLGRSGSGNHRPGFERLLVALCSGEVGAVFCIEASRLARNGRDWHTLLEFCRLVGCLLIDEDGIYDPRQPNDRLLLGMKGTLSEMELSTFRQRSQAALDQKAKRGELFTSVPIGYVRAQGNRIEKDPDTRVREALDLAFRKFREFGSVRQVLLWIRQECIELPAVNYGLDGRHIVWKLPVYNTLLHILTNPIYGGAYAFGKTRTIARIVNGRKRVFAGTPLQREEWQALIIEHHAGYISWDEYEANRKLITNNANMKGSMVRGAVKRGSSLLAGLLRCGHCGRKLHVAYSGTKGTVARYNCQGSMINHGGPRCISFGAVRVDQRVTEEVLRQLQPLGIRASLEAIERARTEQDERVRHKELALEQARYEAARARRQYDAIDPENRLVAAELERRWNETLKTQVQIQTELDLLREQSSRALSAGARDELLRLGEDLPRLWHHPASSVEIKKRILRTVVKEIVATKQDDTIRALVHWQGGDHTEIVFEKNHTGEHRWATDVATIDIVRALARTLADQGVAAVINRLGKRTAKGHTWTAARICTLRKDHRIPAYREGERQERHELTVTEVATLLGISAPTVIRLIRVGRLPASQACLGAPWIIQQVDVDNYLARRAADRPQSDNSNQLSIDLQ
ncbi:DNA binding, excisionase family domain protein [Paraburkholderia xenovorans LB400]|uniref:Excisionase/Xis, DNA-binding protein n=2 Tax=Paraburkholderia TaxID=1822464 RepID=Q13JG2_PARXL|nr:recombinase family protein [Paraburkholderia xenovorans]ABE35777.1 Excisionase/Xis, DNA-binding protein [Paraburkholderia xenovorans LB400]AIP37363.1 DNA binding, excisionase family domain protein [Paraburkholderia xenovorans LB400]